MSNKIKKEIKNKRVIVKGFESNLVSVRPIEKSFYITITNDRVGKTLSIANENLQFTIPFEPIEDLLK